MRIVGILLIAALMVLPVIAAQRDRLEHALDDRHLDRASASRSVLVGLTVVVLRRSRRPAARSCSPASGGLPGRERRARDPPAGLTAVARLGPVLEPLDLQFLGLERAIGVYLVETTDGPALFDCGPATTLPRLEQCLRERDLALTDIRHLLLSHIHFDHAGAAGAIVRRHPGLTVGSRRSARRTSSTRRASSPRAPAVRGRLRPLLGPPGAAPRGEHPHRVGRRGRLGGLPDAGTRVAPRLATSATASCSPATPAGSASSPGATSCRRRRRPTSTSRPGTRRSMRSHAASPKRSR